jgi:threonine dehydrogenase-like Zn-dependent dehydrogenase
MDAGDRLGTGGERSAPGSVPAARTRAGGVTTDALLLDEQLVLTLGTRQLPPPRVGEALVRVAWAGVCGSDLHVLRTGEWVAYWPATLGHEVVGVVQECPGAEMALGTTVVVDSRLPCLKCAGCHKAVSLCHNMSWLGEAAPGGFARHLVAPVSGLVPCPAALEPAIAVLAEPLAVAMHAVSGLACRPDEVLLLGYGPIGALVHLELVRRYPGLPVFVSELFEPRRQLALALGARLAPPSPGAGDPATYSTKSPADREGDGQQGGQGSNNRNGDGGGTVEAVGVGQEDGVSSRGKQLFSLVVDTAGYPQSLSEACALAANGATVLVVALSFDAVTVVPAELVERTLTISGSVGFDDELEGALSVLASSPDRYRPVVSEAVLLEEAADRLAALANEPSAGKVVVRPWSE